MPEKEKNTVPVTTRISDTHHLLLRGYLEFGEIEETQAVILGRWIEERIDQEMRTERGREIGARMIEERRALVNGIEEFVFGPVTQAEVIAPPPSS